MATIKSFTSLEQSQLLAKILPLESADMHYGEYCVGGENYPIPNCDDDYNGHCCWSLAALLRVLPYYPTLHRTINGWRCDIYNEKGYISQFGYDSDNPIDACYEMILKLNELKIL